MPSLDAKKSTRLNSIFNRIKTTIFQNKWETICLIVSFLVLSVFFYKLLLEPNTSYFENGGDGLLTYYNSIWHIKNDSNFFHQHNMNYPYGENVFFTGCQPFLLAPLKIFHLGNYVVGITNLFMLFSIPLSALFIYLIFKEFGQMGFWPCMIAICIAFLSPQVHRLECHYNLTFQFGIPAFCWLLLKFFKNPTYKISLIIAAFVFVFSTIHLYFFAFFLLIAIFYYLYFIFSKQKFTFLKSIIFSTKHFFIQIVFPYAIIWFIMFVTDPVNDRTNNPWGILVYKSNWNGVFFPYGKMQESFVRDYIFDAKDNPLWEGVAYMGLFGTVIAIIFILKFIRNVLNINWRQLFYFTNNTLLNYWIIGAIIALLYSFGYPFICHHEDWLEYLGPLKQMRGIARFSWIFFYIFNIAGALLILSSIKKPIIRNVVLFVTFFILSFDAYQNVSDVQDKLYNKFPEIEDVSNQSPNLHWLTKIKDTNYQAIIPLPYFHVGSENLLIAPEEEILKWSIIVSLKTNLPLLASMYSRTSLSQTCENIQIVLEPNQIPKWVNDLPNNQPFLILMDKNKLLKSNETQLIKKSIFLNETAALKIYSLSVDSLRSFYNSKFVTVDKEFEELKLKKNLPDIGNDFLYSGEKQDYVTKSFDNEEAAGIMGNGVAGMGKNYCILFEDTLPNANVDSIYLASAWVNNINRDLCPRITFIIDLMDSNHNFKRNYIYAMVNDHLKRTDSNWGLVEGEFKLDAKTDVIKIGFFNESLGANTVNEFDELLIIPKSEILYKKINSSTLFKNNRFIYK